MSLEELYLRRYREALVPAARALEELIGDYIRDVPRIDRISARAKSVERFLKKADAVVDGNSKYSAPLDQVQDQIGARIVTFYLGDVARVVENVTKYFTAIERKLITPDSEKEFGYVGRHFILLIPTEVMTAQGVEEEQMPQFFELQVKTLFQHAWAEAEHDLLYKPAVEFSMDEKRKVAFTAAQSWGADVIFDELQQAVVARSVGKEASVLPSEAPHLGATKPRPWPRLR